MPETMGEAVDRHGTSEAFIAAAELLFLRNGGPIGRKTLTEAVGEHWLLAWNGTHKEVNMEPPEAMGCEVPPCHMAIFWNGWLAGLLSPAGGIIAAAMRAALRE